MGGKKILIDILAENIELTSFTTELQEIIGSNISIIKANGTEYKEVDGELTLEVVPKIYIGIEPTEENLEYVELVRNNHDCNAACLALLKKSKLIELGENVFELRNKYYNELDIAEARAVVRAGESEPTYNICSEVVSWTNSLFAEYRNRIDRIQSAEEESDLCVVSTSFADFPAPADSAQENLGIWG
jgi:hypothetical protein